MTFKSYIYISCIIHKKTIPLQYFIDFPKRSSAILNIHIEADGVLKQLQKINLLRDVLVHFLQNVWYPPSLDAIWRKLRNRNPTVT